MRKKLDTLGGILGWFAVSTQFVLMLLNRQAGIFETVIRFFSFFTILTNILVACYFTGRVMEKFGRRFPVFRDNGSLTALTAYIFIVGLVYQLVLRGIWEPTGLQRLVDELLHSILPLFVLVYWSVYSKTEKSTIKNVLRWLMYPIIYILFVLVRGYFSNYYPYPFLNVPELGSEAVGWNIFIIFVGILGVKGILIFIATKRKTATKT